MNLNNYRLVPVWVFPIIVIILMLTCGGCRGGRSLGKGSAGTVIIPRTPQQINKSNRPNFRALPPASLKSARSKPVPQITPAAEAVPVKIKPRAAGEKKPFTPTIPEIAGPCLEAPKTSLISPPQKSGEILESNNEQWICGGGITPQEEDAKDSWLDLFMFYAVCVLALLTSWVLQHHLATKYFKNKKELDNQKKDVKVKKSTPKRKSKKRV